VSHLKRYVRVVPEIHPAPEVVALGLLADEPVEARVELRTAGSGTFWLLAATCDDARVEITIEHPEVNAETPGRLLVRVPASTPVGPYRALLWVATDSEEVPRVRIPLLGESILGVRSDLREVCFGDVPLGESKSVALTITHDANVRIGEARSSLESVRVQNVARATDRTTIRFVSDPDLPLGFFDGHVALRVSPSAAAARC